LWERGSLGDLESLITERITLEEAPAVVAELAQGHRPDTIKTIIHFD